MSPESEPLFRHIAEHSLVGIYINQDGRYAYLNQRLADIFGYTVDEMMALDDWLELVALPDRPLVAEQVRRRLDGEVDYTHYYFRGLRRDGTIINIEVYGSVIEVNGRPAAFGNLIDVTDREQAREALRESEELFRRAFEDTNLPMALTDLDNRFVRVNSAFARMFGYAPDEMLRMTTAQITHPDDIAETFARREPLLQGRETHFHIEKRYLHRDGHVISALTNVALVRDVSNRPQLYVRQAQDITDRKRLEVQVSQSQKMEAIGVLAGGIAHDFNNLLTVMNGYCELISSDPGLSESSREMIREIHRAGDQAAALTRQLLAFSRKQVLAPRVVNLNVLVNEEIKMLRRLVGADIELSTKFEPDIGRIMADPGQVEQVLMNLVVNARDAMPQGGQLSIATSNVELTAEFVKQNVGVRPGSYVKLAISDTGVGMDAATQSRIFEPFFTTKEPGRGTGLGLSTVHGIVKQSGGHLEVDSEPGRGTSISVYLPILTGDESALGPPPVLLEVPRGTETVLLAEDAEPIRNLARVALQSCGYKLLEASNGQEALSLGTLIQPPLHLLITDIVMPKMSGRELAERLRTIHPEVRVLYVSGYTDDAILRHGVVAEGVAFLHKPFTPTTLARRVREVLDSSVTQLGCHI